MRSRRFFFFILSILVGLVLGLLYGWLIKPPAYTDLSLTSLRSDYKADYVLMVAETYRQDNNLPLALRELSQISPLPPARVVAEALLTARDLQYAQPDLETLAYLAQSLQGSNLAPSPSATNGGQP